MKICMFHKLSPPFAYGMPCEGAAKTVLEISKRLAKSNQVFIVNANENCFYDSKNDIVFVGTGTFGLLKKLLSKIPVSTPWIRDTFIHVMIGLMKMPKDIDILHATTPFAIMLKTFFGVKSRLNFLNLRETPLVYKFLSSKHIHSRILRSLFLKNITAVIVPSNYGKSSFVKLFNFNPNRVHVIYNGVNPKWFNCVDPIEKSENTVLFVGAIVPEKGLHYLLKAMKIVQEQIPDAEIKIAGGSSLWYNSPTSNAYYKKVLTLGKRLRNVEFLGILGEEELIKAYREATILVVPSTFENIPNVVLEAMAVGTPVIASGIGGLFEIVKDEKTGVIVPPRDSILLADSIIRLLKDRELRKKLARNAKEMVKNLFNWDESVRQLDEIFSLYLSLIS